jgi:hypothetical protein
MTAGLPSVVSRDRSPTGFELLALGDRDGAVVDVGGELVAVVEQFSASFGQFFEAWRADGFGHAAGLEGVEVAVDRDGGVTRLRFGAGQLR